MCGVEGCDSPRYWSKPYCRNHYYSWRKYGDPTFVERSRSERKLKPAPPKRRPYSFEEYVAPHITEDESGCWLWTGRLDRFGYGRKRRPDKDWLVHRLVWEHLVGPIPPGLELDHLCRVRACCNPAHLEPVTRKENIRRSMAASAIAARTNRCKQGHDLAVHGKQRADGRGRRCTLCDRIYTRNRLNARRNDTAA